MINDNSMVQLNTIENSQADHQDGFSEQDQQEREAGGIDERKMSGTITKGQETKP